MNGDTLYRPPMSKHSLRHQEVQLVEMTTQEEGMIHDIDARLGFNYFNLY